MTQFCTLFSGSSGNAVYIGAGGSALLVDCSMSASQTLAAMAQAGLDAGRLEAILITHEHSDHVKGAGALARKLGLRVCATEGTWAGMERAVGAIPDERRLVVRAGESFFLDGFEALPFAIPHDAAEPVGYRVFTRDASVAVATDMGHFPREVQSAVEGAELVLLESNHDPDLLRQNPHYPERLKRRILGQKGHLSNQSGAEAAVRLLQTGTRHLLLGHLSAENNTPDLAYRAAHAALTEAGAAVGADVTLHVAARFRASYLYTIA